MVAGYCDGPWRWSDADWARFPAAIKVRIALFGATNDGHVIDVEKSSQWTPAQLVDWAQRRRAAGVDPTVYMNRVTWPFVRQAFQAAGVHEPHYWLATLDGARPWQPGVVAIQYAGSALSGGHFDLSDVLDYWPGVDSTPVSPLPDPCAPLRAQLASLQAEYDGYKAKALQLLTYAEEGLQPVKDDPVVQGVLTELDAARGLLT